MQVAPKLNQLLCFGTFVGRWKEITPEQATGLKRHLDETMYASTDTDALLRVEIAYDALGQQFREDLYVAQVSKPSLSSQPAARSTSGWEKF